MQFVVDSSGRLGVAPAAPNSIFEKVFVLNALGGAPTEVLGKTDAGDFVVKQPYGSHSWLSSVAGQVAAEQRARLAEVPDSVLRSIVPLYYSNVDGIDFLVGDLHVGNFAKDTFLKSRIIDLVASRITPEYYAQFPALREWVDAHREAATAPGALQFSKGVAGASDSFVEPGFYSQLQRVISDKMPVSAPVAQIKGIITNPQNRVKQEELKWSDVLTWLDDKEGKVTKDELLNYLKNEGAVKFSEKVTSQSSVWAVSDDQVTETFDTEEEAEARKEE
jgi:hypothetical protein